MNPPSCLCSTPRFALVRTCRPARSGQGFTMSATGCPLPAFVETRQGAPVWLPLHLTTYTPFLKMPAISPVRYVRSVLYAPLILFCPHAFFLFRLPASLLK